MTQVKEENVSPFERFQIAVENKNCKAAGFWAIELGPKITNLIAAAKDIYVQKEILPGANSYCDITFKSIGEDKFRAFEKALKELEEEEIEE